jgi:hypothetical protein
MPSRLTPDEWIGVRVRLSSIPVTYLDMIHNKHIMQHKNDDNNNMNSSNNNINNTKELINTSDVTVIPSDSVEQQGE